MQRFAFFSLFVLCVLDVSSSESQSTGAITVTSGDVPSTGVDIFVLVNQGKQPAGTTDERGTLPFDPALLAGKLKGEAVVRTCAERTEVILVAEGERYTCEKTDEEGKSCRCAPAGLWIFTNGQIDVQLATGIEAPAAESLVRNPIFLGTLGAGAVTAIVVAGGGDDSSSTSLVTSQPSTGTSGSSTTTSTSSPAGGAGTTPSATSLNGNYPGNFVRLRDECNFFVPNFNGTAVVDASESGSLTARVIESITRQYQGTIQIVSDGNGSGTATGSGFIGNSPITCEARLTFTNGRLTIEETIRMPQNNNCAATFRATDLSRQ